PSARARASGRARALSATAPEAGQANPRNAIDRPVPPRYACAYHPPTKGVPTMAIQLGDIAPDFEADTTEGKVRFHDWIGNRWCVLMSHPKDFTPVCTTELGRVANMKQE